MKRSEENFDEVLKRSFECSEVLPQYQSQQAWNEVLLRYKNSKDLNIPTFEWAPLPRAKSTIPLIGFAAVLLGCVILAIIIGFPSSTTAQAQALDGSLARVSGTGVNMLRSGDSIKFGDVLRSAGASALFSLSDGSLVEMHPQSELSLQSAHDGVQLHLDRGQVIVNAAKQSTGHLYVKTKDLDVSVTGTVFLVNAEDVGSRVAVIEGTVHVQNGGEAKTLLPGEQLISSPQLPSRLVVEEISWSRNIEAHLAMLQQSTTAALAPQTSPTTAFAAASLKRVGPDTPIERVGGGCHGVDTKDARVTTRVPRGRCVLSNVTLKDMIWVAYPELPRSLPSMQAVVGGPTWSSTDVFNVEALADDLGSVTEDRLQRMLRSFLGQRFRLRFHLESRQISGYMLSTAKGGARLKETPNGSGKGVLRIEREAGRLSLRGSDIGMFNLVGFLSSRLRAPVLDKTNLNGAYEIDLSWSPLDANNLDMGESILAAVSDLGLELKAGTGESEVLVIDQAEHPADN